MRPRIVGVIGAGVMGSGVSQVLAESGQTVVLIDLSNEILEAGLRHIEQAIRVRSLMQHDRQRPSTESILKQITLSTDYRKLGNADVVIENVPERWEIKKETYASIDRICPKHCFFAANTSAISITRIASVTQRQPQVIGMHFMNPAPLKSTVELIRGHHTSEETVKNARELLSDLGKDSIVVNDSPGFVSNRVFMLMLNEAVYLLQEQVASVEDVDAIFRNCFGHKMGPLETADLIGLDTVLLSIEVLHESFQDSKYRACPLLRKMVDAGMYGRKNGKGFYRY
jgi:3-hydroxybutyryl-CoA dehydrogenase